MKTPTSRHTPSPWRVDGNLENGLHVIDGMDNQVCQVFCIDGDEESEANARLVAAAPDLLHALRHLEAWDFALIEAVKKTWGENILWRKLKEDLRNAKVAIAQATGGAA